MLLIQKSRKTNLLTFLFICLCTALFSSSFFQRLSWEERGLSLNTYLPTAVEAALLFDVPDSYYQVLEKIKHFDNENRSLSKSDVAILSDFLEESSYWRGLLPKIFLEKKGIKSGLGEGPLLKLILEGQIWRFFSPILLHGSLIHLVFNMLWLWFLGKQIETRVGVLKYLLLTLGIAGFSNLIQYLLTGPFFLGYSGVVFGFAGFIWSRRKYFPWEGYDVSFSTFFLLFGYIIFLSCLDVILFLVEWFTSLQLGLSIANSAHIVGAITGYIFGKMDFFELRVK
jgi:GlpG protein